MLEIPFISPDGKMPTAILRSLIDYVRNSQGGRFVLTLKEQKRKRSLNQNDFYHGPFIDAYKEWLLDCGQRLSSKEIHEGLKSKHAKNGYRIELPNGSYFDVPPSTSRFTPLEMEQYLNEIRAEYAPYGFIGPYPNE